MYVCIVFDMLTYIKCRVKRGGHRELGEFGGRADAEGCSQTDAQVRFLRGDCKFYVADVTTKHLKPCK